MKCVADALFLATLNLGNSNVQFKDIAEVGAVHNQVIESRQLYEEAARHSGVIGGVLEGLMMSVAETVYRHLRMGDKVRLKEFGLFKLEIESDKVDNLKDFRAKKHIRGVRLHFNPESENGSPELYQDITFERVKDSV